MGNEESVTVPGENECRACTTMTPSSLRSFFCKISSPPSKSLYSYRFRHQAVGISCIFSQGDCAPTVLNRKRIVLRILVPNAPSYKFLRCCFRCNKDLRDNNVYIYRGEWSFCSDECRNVGVEAKLGKQNVKSSGGPSKFESSRTQNAGPVIFFLGD